MPGHAIRRRAAIGAIAALSIRLPEDDLEEALAIVAAAMAKIHGGRWRAHVDHVAGFILIGPQTDPTPSS